MSTERKTIDRLIINGPYHEPNEYWDYIRERRNFVRKEGRRPAGYLKASEQSRMFDDPGIFVEIPRVNYIRDRVRSWRRAGYPGVTSITKRLLEHWNDPEQFDIRRFFFCQLEAAETLIWLTEAPQSETVGLDIPGDGGEFQRLCSKMATGTGKTVVMAMLIAWHILNKTTYPQDPRFSKNIIVVAPGLTVKNRLEVINPAATNNYYREFDIVPSTLAEKLNQGKVRIRNWHALNWESDEDIAKKRSVDKRGAKSDEAYVRDVLDEMSRARNLLVINDEAHHAWRTSNGKSTRGILKADRDQATKWIGGLDRIHRARGILTCYDFSATPFVPSGRSTAEESLFGWIVSDFGLNDAIESGLVKTPRVVVRDDAVPDTKTYRSRLYHIYNDPDVRDDLNRRAQPHEPLPDLVNNAYHLLGYDWRETANAWQESGHRVPPVMITVANRTETAARVNHALTRKRVHIEEMCDPERILHIDSRVLKQAEDSEEPIATVAETSNGGDDQNGNGHRRLTAKERAELLRTKVDTVGKPGKPGEKVQNVISVGMLSEGWDAKTVTHIMGLRAFTSQLLCEQVVGRGLRRTSYELNDAGMFDPEYVNIFGVPFTFLPHEQDDSGPPPPPTPKTAIEPVPEKLRHEITWPNIIRIDRVLRPQLSLQLENVEPLELDASKTTKIAELAPTVDGKPDLTQINDIDLNNLAKEFRTQKIIFEAARDVFEQMQPNWEGGNIPLIAQLIKIVEQFITSDLIQITPPLFNHEDLKRRLVITLNMNRVVQHIINAIHSDNAESIVPIFDTDRPIRSTSDMQTWYTGKPCEHTKLSHINMCVYDSTWEASEAFEIDRNPNVQSWVKNDHLGFEVLYLHNGIIRKYRPDYLIRLKSGTMIVLEVKGQHDDQSRTKRRFLQEWTRAVNQHGGFGHWQAAMSQHPAEVRNILARQKS